MLPRVPVASLLLAAACHFDGSGLTGEPPAATTASPASATTAETSSTGPAATTTTSGVDGSSSRGATTGTPVTPPRWEKTYPADLLVAVDLALSPTGDPLIAGSSGPSTASDAWIAAYARDDGEALWTVLWDMAAGTDQANALAVTPLGEVLVAGDSDTPDRGRDAWLLRVTATGVVQEQIHDIANNAWHPSLVADEWAMAIGYDPLGFIWIGGARCASPCAGSEAWLARLEATFGKQSPGWEVPSALAGGGMIRGLQVIAGKAATAGTTGWHDADAPWLGALRVVASDHVAAMAIDPPGPADRELLAVAAAPDGSLWVAGRAREAGSIGGFLRRYSPELSLRAAVELDGEAVDIAVAGEQVFAVGSAKTGSDERLWVRAFDGDGVTNWSYEQEASEGAAGLGLALDAARGEIVALGAVKDGARRLWLGRFGLDGT